jgi:hypothetical protein
MKIFNRTKIRPLTIISALLLVVALTSAWMAPGTSKKAPYHSEGEMVQMMMQSGQLPTRDNGYFLGSGRCAGCHGVDPIAYANITMEGEQVSPAENWRATMMANSAKDPLWLAKVAHETTTNPMNAQALVNKCTSCHAPVGRFTHLLMGQENYSMDSLATDSLARDGVNCGACHQQRLPGLGSHFSGELRYHTDTIWGPFVSEEMNFPIFSEAMQSFVGYMPLGNHTVSKSEFCATCHSLITETADLNGNLTGGTFIEQATYHEWLNSSFNNDDPLVGKECQGCHMPRLDEPIVIASGYSFLPGRQPFGQHWFVGGNSFMLGLMKNNIDSLKITATQDHFDRVIDRTLDNLQNHTADVQLITGDVDGDTARFSVRIINKVGHKFPSGYPARRAYIEFIATDDNGNEIFHSGKMNSMYEVIGQDPLWEPHYQTISADHQVQIYEMVMGDVNGNPTTVLERAATMLKDNRLVPPGFSTTHSAYDSTMIVGTALLDPDFNHDANGTEGSGSDIVHYHIPVTGINGPVHVSARLMYQSVPPKWVGEMFAIDHPMINRFEQMYWAEGADPVQVGSADATVLVASVGNIAAKWSIGPNPTTNGQIQILAPEVVDWIAIYNLQGQLIERKRIMSNRATLQLPDESGTYIIEISSNHFHRIEKVLKR